MSLDETKRPQDDELLIAALDEAAVETAQDDPFAAFVNPVIPDEKKPKKGKISRRMRTVWIALGAVVVLVAVLLLIPLLPQEQPLSSGEDTSDTSDTDSQTIAVLNKTSEDSKLTVVTKVNVQSETENFTLHFDDKEDVYRLTGYEDIDLDADTVGTLADSAAVLNATQKIKEVASLSEYGLDTPAYTITVTYHDASTATLLIGDVTPDGEGYYVKLADGEEVYICSVDALSPFRTSYLELVETTLISPPTVKEDDENGSAILRNLTMTGKKLSSPLTIRRSVKEDGTEMMYYNYIISMPYKRGLTDAVIASISTMTSLTASQGVVLHPSDADLTKYGFKEPLMVAQLTLCVESVVADDTSSDASSETSDTSTEEEETEYIYYGSTNYKITIGGTTEDGDYLVMLDGIDAIYLVNYDSLSPIAERTYENTVSTLLFLKDITQLSRVEVMHNGTVYNFKLTHNPDKEDNDDKMTVTMGGKTYDTDNFRTLYELMMELQRYGTTDQSPSGQPELAISLYDLDGKLYLSTELYPLSGSLYITKTTEGELFTTKASNVTHFVKQLQNYLDNKTVLSSN